MGTYVAHSRTVYNCFSTCIAQYILQKYDTNVLVYDTNMLVISNGLAIVNKLHGFDKLYYLCFLLFLF